MLFGFSKDEFRCVPGVFAYLLNVCKFLVWSQWNDYHFRSEPPSALRLLACLRARVGFYLPFLFKHFISNRRRFFLSSMGCQWCCGPCCWRCFRSVPLGYHLSFFPSLLHGRLSWSYCVVYLAQSSLVLIWTYCFLI